LSVTSTLLPRKHLVESQNESLQTILATVAPTFTEKELPFFSFFFPQTSVSQTTVYTTMKISLSSQTEYI